MKLHILLFCAAALTLAGCGAATRQQNREQRQAQEAETARQVRQQVPAGDFKISVNLMIPTRGSSKVLSDPYFVKVNDNRLESHLPYFGRAYNIPYGGGKGLTFETDITSYNWKETKPGVFDITIIASNEEDTYEYDIRLFDNGSASIEVRPRNREHISYQGEWVPAAAE